MTPIMKKSGRTVFGVRIGLKNRFSSEGLLGDEGKVPTAKLSDAVAGRRYLDITVLVMSFDEEKEHTSWKEVWSYLPAFGSLLS